MDSAPVPVAQTPHHAHEHAHGEHGHEHHHEHHSAVDYSQGNRTHFDKMAEKYDDVPFALELTASIGRAFLKEFPFDEEKTTAMDFACGTGLVSRQLAPHAKQIVGVDISQGMVDQYNLRVLNQGIPPEEMRAIRAELKGTEDELDGQKFDVVFCSMAYHHFESINTITQILSVFLKPGGVLLVADLVKAQPQTLIPYMDPTTTADLKQVATDFKHVVAHRGGFDEATMRSTFEEAGLSEFAFRPCVRVSKGEKELNVFVAKAVKAGAL